MRTWRPLTRIGLLAPLDGQLFDLADQLRASLLYFERIMSMSSLGQLAPSDREALLSSERVEEILREWPESDNPMELPWAPPADVWIPFFHRSFELPDDTPWDPIALRGRIERELDDSALIVPVYAESPGRPTTVSGSRCLQVVLKTLPVPARSVPLKDVLDFVDDPEVARKRRALFRWQSEAEREELRPREVLEMIASHLDEYCEHMRLQEMKFQQSLVKQIILLVPKVIEELLHLRLSSAVDAMVSFREVRLSLRESELVAPGRELAYISMAHDRFGQR